MPYLVMSDVRDGEARLRGAYLIPLHPRHLRETARSMIYARDSLCPFQQRKLHNTVSAIFET